VPPTLPPQTTNPQAPGLPKTRSGKIMRRVLRKIASKEEDQLGDTSTLADPSVVQQLVRKGAWGKGGGPGARRGERGARRGERGARARA
jgi:hypothetical protein